MTDYGTDISTRGDLDPTFALISGVNVELESILREFSTPQGALWWATEYGADLRALLDSALDTKDVKALELTIQRRLLKRDRVEKATATVTFDFSARSITVSVAIEGADGPFDFVFTLDASGLAKLVSSS